MIRHESYFETLWNAANNLRDDCDPLNRYTAITIRALLKMRPGGGLSVAALLLLRGHIYTSNILTAGPKPKG